MAVALRRMAVNVVGLGLFAVLLLIVIIGVADLLHDYTQGGRRWQQGDWMIHSLSGVVRRGTIGTVTLLLGDVTSINPLALTIALQIAIFVGLIFVLFLIGATVLTHPVQIAALVLPPFYPMMMVSRFDGMIYKEIIAFLALALLTLGVVRPHLARWLMPLGVAVLLIGCFAHEALVFFLPVAVFLIHLAGRTRFTDTLIAVLTAGTLAALAFALTYSKADPDAVCAELLIRGLSPILCEGPVSWLDETIAHAIDVTVHETRLIYLVEFFAVWLLAVLVLGYLLGRGPKQSLFLGFLTLFPFLPLFLLAFDFGRWFSFGFTSMVFVLLALGGFRRLPGQGALAVLVVLATSIITFGSTRGVYFSGLVNRALELLS
ncbi:MAG: hypothetical protein AAGA05_04485 [Pseudomonadota bacterium]